MIHLSGRDSFVIYQDTVTNKNKIAIGKWCLFDFKKNITNTYFVCNAFNKETYFIDGEISRSKKINVSRKNICSKIHPFF